MLFLTLAADMFLDIGMSYNVTLIFVHPTASFSNKRGFLFIKNMYLNMLTIHKATIDIILVVEFLSPFCDTLEAVLSLCRLNWGDSAKQTLAID